MGDFMQNCVAHFRFGVEMNKIGRECDGAPGHKAGPEPPTGVIKIKLPRGESVLIHQRACELSCIDQIHRGLSSH